MERTETITVLQANDSYFRVVSQFSGLTTRDAFSILMMISLLQRIPALLTAILNILW